MKPPERLKDFEDGAPAQMKKLKYKDWTVVDWDGNPSLKLKCWRKSFGRGQVSVGIGAFYLIAYSFGANSDNSYSSTRDRTAGVITEPEAMAEAECEVKAMT